MQEDSLGFFGKWFPTEEKKYTAMIVMLYVGVAVTVIGALCDLVISGLNMIGIFGLPPSLQHTVDTLELVSGIGSLVSLALLVLMIYLLYKTRSLFYLLKMFLGYFVVSLLFGLIAALVSGKIAFLLLLIGIGATIYVNRSRWHYISKYRRYIYYVLGTWVICAVGNILVGAHIFSSLSSIFFGFNRLSSGTIFGYVVLIVLLWLLPVFCQHYIYRREQHLGTPFYQAFRLLSTVPWTALFFIFGISSLANIGTLSGEGMFAAFDFDYTGQGISLKPVTFPQDMATAGPAAAQAGTCPHCGAAVTADAAFCSHCGTKLRHCPACGQIVTDKAKFCPACGAYLLTKPAAEATEKAAQAAQNPPVPPLAEEKKPRSAQPAFTPAARENLLADKRFLVAAAVVVAVLIGGGVYWYTSRDSAAPQNTAPVLTPKDDSSSVPEAEMKKTGTDAAAEKKKDTSPAIKAEDGAQQAFLDYHQNITQHNIQGAFGLLDTNFQNTVGGYNGYAPGYDNTLSSEVTQLQKISASANQEVLSFTLKARDKVPGSSQVKVQYFTGQATLVKDGANWKISEITAQKTGEKTE